MVVAWGTRGGVALVRMLTSYMYQYGSNSSLVPCIISGWGLFVLVLLLALRISH